MRPKTCTICGKPVILQPSAETRSKRYDESAQYYLDLFPDHAKCLVEKRSNDSVKLASRISGESSSTVIVDEIPLEQRLRHARAH